MLSLQANAQASNINLEIIKGQFQVQPKTYYAHNNPVNFSSKQAVWVAEEKQTDVALAVHLLCDAFENQCEQQVIVSNDSDLAPAIEAIKARQASRIIGVIAPIKGEERLASSALRCWSDWTRGHIREIELKSAQLPSKVKTRKRSIAKPTHW